MDHVEAFTTHARTMPKKVAQATDYRGLVSIEGFGTVTRAMAEANGFTIEAAPPKPVAPVEQTKAADIAPAPPKASMAARKPVSTPAKSPSSPLERIALRSSADIEQARAYRAAVFALPEAAARPAAAERLASSYGPRSMPIAKAQTLLASLPLESTKQKEKAMTSEETAKLQRVLELKTAGIAASSNNDPVRLELGRKMSYTSKLLASGMGLEQALSISGLKLADVPR